MPARRLMAACRRRQHEGAQARALVPPPAPPSFPPLPLILSYLPSSPLPIRKGSDTHLRVSAGIWRTVPHVVPTAMHRSAPLHAWTVTVIGNGHLRRPAWTMAGDGLRLLRTGMMAGDDYLRPLPAWTTMPGGARRHPLPEWTMAEDAHPHPAWMTIPGDALPCHPPEWAIPGGGLHRFPEWTTT